MRTCNSSIPTLRGRCLCTIGVFGIILRSLFINSSKFMGHLWGSGGQALHDITIRLWNVHLHVKSKENRLTELLALFGEEPRSNEEKQHRDSALAFSPVLLVFFTYSISFSCTKYISDVSSENYNSFDLGWQRNLGYWIPTTKLGGTSAKWHSHLTWSGTKRCRAGEQYVKLKEQAEWLNQWQ